MAFKRHYIIDKGKLANYGNNDKLSEKVLATDDTSILKFLELKLASLSDWTAPQQVLIHSF